MKRERLSPVDFYEQEVLPALFERLDVAFPDFGWTRKGGGWVATNHAFTKSLPGEPRPDRVVCNVPFGFYVHGGGPTSWVAYVHGGATPGGADFVAAVRKLAGLAGVDASPLDRERTEEEGARFQERERRRGLFETFLGIARTALLGDEGKAARTYLTGRGFPEEALKELDLGLYTTPADVEEKLKDAGFTKGELDASGLLKDGRWEGRLVGAWRNRWGHIGTFYARDLAGEADEGAKYLYLSGAPKGALVAFGLDVALRTEEGRENLVLLEGLLDAVSLHHQGFPNVAAIGGAGGELSRERWEKLAAFGVRAVTLALDNDDPGRNGTRAALENASKANNVPVVYVVAPRELAPHKDPDELVRRDGLESFRAVLGKAQAGPSYHAETLLEDVSPESGERARRDAVDRVLAYADRLRDLLAREDILRVVAERTGYTFETLAELAEDRATRRQKEETRRTLGTLLRDAQTAQGEGRDAGAVAHELAEGLATLTAQAVGPPLPFSVDRLERESAKVPAGKRSGWDAVDRLEVRFNPGELALLGARTGHGKTSALVCLLRRWLEETEGTDETLVFYSAEEPEVRVCHRLLALASDRKWTPNEVRDYLRDVQSRESWPGTSLDEEKERLRSWEDRLLVVHRPAWTVADLDAHARELASRQNLGAVLVDYLQRIPGPAGRYERRDIEVSTVGRRLKSLSVDLSCPVVAGAQINREAVPDKYREKLAGKSYKDALSVVRSARPYLENLREGGSEQEADLVLGLLNYRADIETDEDGDRVAGGAVPDVTRFEVGTLKNRYGTPGRWARLAFEGRFGLLRDPIDEREV